MTLTVSSRDEDFDSDGDKFFEQVYYELRQLAHAKMKKEFLYSTLQGTALVHEAWLRMGAEGQPHWQNRGHFFSAAAEAMQRILIDRARRRNRTKYGGKLRRVSVEDMDKIGAKQNADEELLKINEALAKFEATDERKAQLVKLRYFLGLSYEDTAETMGISVSTARRWWDYSRTWLLREICSD